MWHKFNTCMEGEIKHMPIIIDTRDILFNDRKKE